MREHEELKRRREDRLQELSGKYRFLTLNKVQTRLLCSFESMMVVFDILNTKKKESAKAKAEWLSSWEESVCESLSVDRDGFFIRSGRHAFDLLEEISSNL